MYYNVNEPEMRAWIAALRSGDYEQGQSCLRSHDNKYCCLGVRQEQWMNQQDEPLAWVQKGATYAPVSDWAATGFPQRTALQGLFLDPDKAVADGYLVYRDHPNGTTANVAVPYGIAAGIKTLNIGMSDHNRVTVSGLNDTSEHKNMEGEIINDAWTFNDIADLLEATFLSPTDEPT